MLKTRSPLATLNRMAFRDLNREAGRRWPGVADIIEGAREALSRSLKTEYDTR